MLNFAVILDRSGSMQTRKDDHEGGLRSFVAEQQKLNSDEMRFTFIQFDDQNPCEVVIDQRPLATVTPEQLVLIPRGSTPLLDAIGKGVAHLRQTLKPEDNTVVCIITDGHENASKEWTKARVKGLVEELEKANWKFLFLGANMDAYAEAGGLGVHVAGVAVFDVASAAPVRAMYAGLSANTSEGREGGEDFKARKERWNWKQEQIAKMKDEADKKKQ